MPAQTIPITPGEAQPFAGLSQLAIADPTGQLVIVTAPITAKP